MTYHGQVTNGQIVLEERVQLPEGTTVSVEVTPQKARITRAKNSRPLRKVQPVIMPGASLADELIRDRR